MLACGTAGWLPSGCVLASYVAVPVESGPVLNIQRYCKGEFEILGLLGLRKIPLRFYGGKGVTLYMSGVLNLDSGDQGGIPHDHISCTPKLEKLQSQLYGMTGLFSCTEDSLACSERMFK